MPGIVQIAFGLFLIVHGLIHVSWIAPRPKDAEDYPFDLSRSPINERMGKPIEPETLALLGRTAATVAVVAFTLAGLGVLGVPVLSGIWRVCAIVGAFTSLDVTTMFWHRWFVAAPILDVLIMIAAFAGWPVA
ncbi:MAG: hypothetical protein HY876_06370 [Coriobacteriales bacterium]|nr:hypothetical protein [Coriobacteriales bacterium]